LDRDARTRAFGIPMDAELLRAGIDRWPGLELEQFLLLEERATGALVGCIAPWDATPVKQTYVTAYRGAMRWVRRGHAVLATLLGAPRLPRPGHALRYAYATHHAVTEPDPGAHAVLLHAAWKAVRGAGGGQVFLSCRAPLADPHDPSYGGFVTSDLPAHVYAVVPHGRPLPDALEGVDRIGFEMAFV
ncbi:MAG: hypothetical protein JWN72_1947, partial [Thermoleophilia bacterium]|nr:hypothetical protein [Thermoleophilia bacterium]